VSSTRRDSLALFPLITYLPTLDSLSEDSRAHRRNSACLPQSTTRSSLLGGQSRSVTEQAHHGNGRADLGVVGAGGRGWQRNRGSVRVIGREMRLCDGEKKGTNKSR